MPLSDLHVVHVCNLQSKSNDGCRYLSEDSLINGVYHCLKLTGQKRQIDDAVADHIRTDSSDDRVPLGDNCPGYPVLQHATVGDDRKKSS